MLPFFPRCCGTLGSPCHVLLLLRRDRDGLPGRQEAVLQEALQVPEKQKESQAQEPEERHEVSGCCSARPWTRFLKFSVSLGSGWEGCTAQKQHPCFSPGSPRLDSQCCPIIFLVLLQRFIDNTASNSRQRLDSFNQTHLQ